MTKLFPTASRYQPCPKELLVYRSECVNRLHKPDLGLLLVVPNLFLHHDSAKKVDLLRDGVISKEYRYDGVYINIRKPDCHGSESKRGRITRKPRLTS